MKGQGQEGQLDFSSISSIFESFLKLSFEFGNFEQNLATFEFQHLAAQNHIFQSQNS